MNIRIQNVIKVPFLYHTLSEQQLIRHVNVSAMITIHTKQNRGKLEKTSHFDIQYVQFWLDFVTM